MERLYGEYEYTFEDTERAKGMEWVQKYLRMKHVIVFKLSHDVLQVRDLVVVPLVPLLTRRLVQLLRSLETHPLVQRSAYYAHRQGVYVDAVDASRCHGVFTQPAFGRYR